MAPCHLVLLDLVLRVADSARISRLACLEAAIPPEIAAANKEDAKRNKKVSKLRRIVERKVAKADAATTDKKRLKQYSKL